MKKIINIQSKNYKNITHLRVGCYEFGAGSTYKAKLHILVMGKDGIIKSFDYKYTLENIYKLLDIIFLPYKLDKRIIYNLKNESTKRF